MFKEIKYIIFVFIIGLFIFFTAKYYFSDAYKKKSYRSLMGTSKIQSGELTPFDKTKKEKKKIKKLKQENSSTAK